MDGQHDLGPGQRVLRTMTVLIGLLNLTLTAATAVLVLLVKERLNLGPVGYGTLFTCMAAGALLGSACGDWLIRRVTAPYWAGFVVAALVSAATWRVFNRAAVAEAYAEPALSGTAQPGHGRRPAAGYAVEYRWRRW